MAVRGRGDWPAKARNAAMGLTKSAQEESPIGALLLDIMVKFVKEGSAQKQAGVASKAGGARVFSRDLAEWLNGWADRPWMIMRKGKEVTELWLAQVLRPYGIKPKTIWIGEKAAKGYVEDEFTDTFRRYIARASALAFIKELQAPAKRPGEEAKATGAEATELEG